MTLSYRWLLQYLPEPVSLDELSALLTAIGLEVEGIDAIGGGPTGEYFVVGKVETCMQHPNADRLKLTTVNVGEGKTLLSIVCGAPNVSAGEKIIVALPGALIQPKTGEPFTIKKSKIRGESSEGMLCSAAELGISDDASGLLLLSDDAVPGTPAADYFGTEETDAAIHIGLTPNRSDAASHLGTARDLCAALSHRTGKRWNVQFPKERASGSRNRTEEVKVSIETEDCDRYAGLLIQGVQVGPSPKWLQKRLTAIGLRSINNIVDITNFVLHEWGQPLHAFDADRIAGGKIVVRNAAAGEKFNTLDGVERNLNAGDILICDTEKPLALAGVMGGQNSGVSAATTAVFLESALFNPTAIRRTSMHYGLRTDAATHFEKGVDPSTVIPALRRAADLILEVAGGEAISTLTDKYPHLSRRVEIELSLEGVNRLAGKQYSADTIGTILSALGFDLHPKGKNSWRVTVPTYKTDVHQEADLVEEILRIDGLDQILMPESIRMPLMKRRRNNRGMRTKVAEMLLGAGYTEILTNSIVDSKWYGAETPLVRLCNNLSADLDVLRPSLLESGLEVVAYNLNRKVSGMQLFESGKTYASTGEAGRYLETPVLGIWATGNRGLSTWKGAAPESDFYSLKGVVEILFEHFFDVALIQWSIAENQIVGRIDAQVLVYITPVAQDRLDLFGIKQAVFYAEIPTEVLFEQARTHEIVYREIAKLPSIERDLSLVLPAGIDYAQVEAETLKASLPLLQRFNLFDVFESEKLGKDKKALALRFVFQPAGVMPTDVEIDGWMQKLTTRYQDALGAVIRL